MTDKFIQDALAHKAALTAPAIKSGASSDKAVHTVLAHSTAPKST